MSIPMAHPMPAPANCSTRFSKELKPHGTGPASSPASMRAFNRSSNVGSGDGNATVSPTSVIAFEDGAGRSNDAGEFSSEEQSHELRNLHGVKESSDFNYSNWAFTDSLLSLDFESSSHSSAKNADFNDEREYACDVKRAPILTFTVNNDSDNDDVDGDGNRNEALVDECEPVKPAPVTNGKLETKVCATGVSRVAGSRRKRCVWFVLQSIVGIACLMLWVQCLKEESVLIVLGIQLMSLKERV
ncbi:hypothetical protein S83_028052 [Arachis hypogaea]